MLTELRFKNWRSLRDVTISDLTPITVFVGANSSGKTNILDGLHFLKRSITAGVDVAVYNWQGLKNIRSLSADVQDVVEVAIAFNWNEITDLSEKVVLATEEDQLVYERKLAEGEHVFPALLVNQTFWMDVDGLAQMERTEQIARLANLYKRDRWQLLREDMTPPLTLDSNNDFADPFSIDSRARNLPMMLDFMRQQKPIIYAELQADLRWLLSHIQKLETRRDERETRVIIHEKMHGDTEAPTISGGTARVLAMLTAYYALDMRSPELPGLVVIEEPDTAIHPLLLENLVDLLRSYTERQERPRQFILTTHNPHFLDYFRPEEVRVVERDPETGETFVDTISDSIKEIWLPKHSLGDAWTSRVIGGIPTE